MSAASDQDDDAGGAIPRYSYKPSLMGAPCEFALEPGALHWQIGRYSGRLPYNKVSGIRLVFRPQTTQSHRFLTEIRSADTPKIRISSVSWRSLVEQERLDAAYTAFVTELHRRLALAHSTARFDGGLPAVPYWLGVAAFASVIAAAVVMVVHAMRAAQWGAAALVGGFFLVFAFQLGNFFRRNRPVRYRPDALPQILLPRGK